MNHEVFQKTKGFGRRSTYPCTHRLTLSPWIYLVPQFKPESVLVLGYAGGTVAGLVRRLYGDSIPIAGVDNNEMVNLYDADLIKMDAEEYVQDCPFFDAIVVDLWHNEPCECVFKKDFVDSVASACNYLIVHVETDSDMSAYSHLRLYKVLEPFGSHKFCYFQTGRRRVG